MITPYLTAPFGLDKIYSKRFEISAEFASCREKRSNFIFLTLIQSSGSIGGRPIGGTLPFLEKNISGSIGGTLKMSDCQIFCLL